MKQLIHSNTPESDILSQINEWLETSDESWQTVSKKKKNEEPERVVEYKIKPRTKSRNNHSSRKSDSTCKYILKL